MNILGYLQDKSIVLKAVKLFDHIDYDNVADYMRYGVSPEILLLNGIADYLKEQYGLRYWLDYDLDFSLLNFEETKVEQKFRLYASNKHIGPERFNYVKSNLLVRLIIKNTKTFNYFKLQGTNDFSNLEYIDNTLKDIINDQVFVISESVAQAAQYFHITMLNTYRWK